MRHAVLHPVGCRIIIEQSKYHLVYLFCFVLVMPPTYIPLSLLVASWFPNIICSLQFALTFLILLFTLLILFVGHIFSPFLLIYSKIFDPYTLPGVRLAPSTSISHLLVGCTTSQNAINLISWILFQIINHSLPYLIFNYYFMQNIM